MDSNNILKLFNRFKLGNSLFTHRYSLNREYIHNSKLTKENIESIARRQSTIALSDFILNQHSSAIKREEREQDILISTELLVLKLDDFKSIVECAIAMLPEERIREIRR